MTTTYMNQYYKVNNKYIKQFISVERKKYNLCRIFNKLIK